MSTRKKTAVKRKASASATGRRPVASASSSSPKKKRNENFFDLVIAVVKQIPRGKVTTYGEIAGALSHKRAARMVGWALNRCGDRKAPCHRVVNRNGELTGKFHFGDNERMRLMLKAEKIIFNGDRVDMKRHLWVPPMSKLRKKN